MSVPNGEQKFLVVDVKVLPEVFERVVEAKKLLATGAVKSLSAAAKEVGISRSALYKYKDCVFTHNENAHQVVATMTFNLLDNPGVLSVVINRISELGANILTVNQNIPVDGVAPVSISVRVGRSINLGDMLAAVYEIDGVVEGKLLSTQ